jgi:hypothetical protein
MPDSFFVFCSWRLGFTSFSVFHPPDGRARCSDEDENRLACLPQVQVERLPLQRFTPVQETTSIESLEEKTLCVFVWQSRWRSSSSSSAILPLLLSYSLISSTSLVHLRSSPLSPYPHPFLLFLILLTLILLPRPVRDSLIKLSSGEQLGEWGEEVKQGWRRKNR